jgi:L-ascorbate metabolism protein UlaG (beta-lactamase superfamily)
VILITVLVAAAFWSDSDSAEFTRTGTKDGLRTIKSDWVGVPIDQRGRFMNHEHPFLPKTRDLIKWQLSNNPFSEEKAADDFRPKVLDPKDFLEGHTDGLIWLGHASFYIRLNGNGILLDPVFGDPPFISRVTKVKSPLDLLMDVDYVLLSHDHRDHMDENTLRQIAVRFPGATFLAGLGSNDVLSSWTTQTNSVMTAGWFQQFAIADSDIEIFFLPVRHWSRRGLFDTNKRLWGGYVICAGDLSIYFSGDSGYGSHYRETGELFPEIDYFLIAIGAYEPRWFMEPNHTRPADAVQAFLDIGAKRLVPMHYATFDLSDEPPGAPLRELQKSAELFGISEKLRVLSINEHIAFRDFEEVGLNNVGMLPTDP